MAKNFIQSGKTIQFTAKKAVKSGDIVVIGDLAVVALADVENKGKGIAMTEGVFTVKAKSEDNIKQGATLYWSESEGATTTKASNKVLGVAWSDAEDGVVDVKLNG